MPIDDLAALGQKMRIARKEKELTQQELADLSHVSIKQITIFYKGIMPSEKILDLPVDCNTLTGSVNLGYENINHLALIVKAHGLPIIQIARNAVNL